MLSPHRRMLEKPGGSARRAREMRLRHKMENVTPIEEIANNVADLVGLIIGYFLRTTVSYFTRLLTNNAH